MSTITTPVTLTTGVNPDVPLYAGAEVQVAQAARIEQLPTLAEIEASTLAKEATVTAAQTALVGEVNANEAKIDTLQTAVAAIPAAPSAAAIRAEIEASTVLAKADLDVLGPFTFTKDTRTEAAGAYTLYASFAAPISWIGGGLVTYSVVRGLTDAVQEIANGTAIVVSPANVSTNNLVTEAGCIVRIPTAVDIGTGFVGGWHLQVRVGGILRGQAALLPTDAPHIAADFLNSFGPFFSMVLEEEGLAKEATLNTRASQASVTALQTSIPASVWDASERTLNGPLFK